jgi:hypothetical protein
MRSSSSPRARWNRLEQAEQAAPPAARRGAERDRGIAFVRAAALSCRRGSWLSAMKRGRYCPASRKPVKLCQAARMLLQELVLYYHPPVSDHARRRRRRRRL